MNSEQLEVTEVSVDTNMRNLGLNPMSEAHRALYREYTRGCNVARMENKVPPSKRKLFKDAHGISKTRVQAMAKRGLKWTSAEDVEVYKDQRKIEREKVRKVQARKYEDSKLWRRTKGKVRKSKHKKRTKGWQSGTRKPELTLG